MKRRSYIKIDGVESIGENIGFSIMMPIEGWKLFLEGFENNSLSSLYHFAITETIKSMIYLEKEKDNIKI